jgi:DNA polymerase-3 subunit beta
METTVPAKLLGEVLNTIPGENVSIKTDKENIIIETQDTIGTLATISAAEFPKPPFDTEREEKNETTEFKTKEILQAVGRVAFAASIDEGKPVLNTVNLTNEESEFILVATDGYRLARQTLPVKSPIEELLIPAKTLLETLKIASDFEEEEVTFSSDKDSNQLVIKGSNFQVATRLVNGTYPNYKQIIPTSFPTTLNINRETLLTAIKSTAVFARDLGNVVTFSLTKPNKVSLKATTAQIGEGSTELSGEVQGENLTVSFNSHYFADGLTNLKSEKVKVEFSGQLSPAIITAEGDKGFSYVVMPVKAQK